MPETAALDDLLSTKQLCDLLHVNKRTVRRMELLGELPAPIRAGRRKTWRRETIEAWLADHEGGSR
jgi:excisionase family DNA binding protein